MEQFKKITIIWIFFCILLFTTGCSVKGLSESEIKELIPEWVLSPEINGEILETEDIQIEIVKRKTDTDEKTDSVWCEILFSDKNYEYTKYVQLSLDYYDKGGWQLESLAEYQDAKFIVKAAPLSEDDIRKDIPEEVFSVTIDNRSVRMKNQKIELMERDTNGEEGVDKVRYKITLSDDIYEFIYYVELSYGYYVQSRWKLNNWDFFKEFEYTVKENPISTDDVIKCVRKDISQKNWTYDSIECVGFVWGAQNQTAKYVIELQEYHTYCTLSRKIACNYTFDGRNWSVSMEYGSNEENWYIPKANYRFEKDGNTVYAAIYDGYDEAQKVIDASFYFEYRGIILTYDELYERKKYPVIIYETMRGSQFRVMFNSEDFEDRYLCFSYDEVSLWGYLVWDLEMAGKNEYYD